MTTQDAPPPAETTPDRDSLGHPGPSFTTPGADGPGSSGRRRVQSVERALALLDALADRGGVAPLTALVDATGLPVATIHRLMATLRDAGYVRQESNRHYALGIRLVRMGESAGDLVGDWVKPVLRRLVEETGETANVAMLDGDQAVYMAQVPSPHLMRMFTEVGRRVDVHCTAVGKALVAHLDDAAISRILRQCGMPPSTRHTMTDEATFMEHIRRVREQGYACDEEEKEEGVRCLAVAVTVGSTPLAVSVSGPEARFTPERRDAAIAVVQRAAENLRSRQ